MLLDSLHIIKEAWVYNLWLYTFKSTASEMGGGKIRNLPFPSNGRIPFQIEKVYRKYSISCYLIL